MPWMKNENLLINFKNPGIQKINHSTLNCKYCYNEYKKNNALQKKKMIIMQQAIKLNLKWKTIKGQ